jgi:hypothetical protein
MIYYTHTAEEVLQEMQTTEKGLPSPKQRYGGKDTAKASWKKGKGCHR